MSASLGRGRSGSPGQPLKVRLVAGTKGCSLRDVEHGHQVVALSWMEAARLLFQMKDEIRRSRTGRGCLDSVHAMRTRSGSTR